MIAHRVELEVHQVRGGQVFEPVRQVTVTQVQRTRSARVSEPRVS